MSCLEHPKAIAWGETGLDFKKNNSPHDVQKTAFIDQVCLTPETIQLMEALCDHLLTGLKVLQIYEDSNTFRLFLRLHLRIQV